MLVKATCFAVLVAAASAQRGGGPSTCGKDPKSVKDCDKPDFGSCGNACCLVDASFKGTTNASHTHEQLVGYLQKGGDDKSFSYSTGADAAGHVSKLVLPSPDFRCLTLVQPTEPFR